MCPIEYTHLLNQQSVLSILRGVDKEFVLSTRRVSESSHLIKDQNKTEKSRNRQTIRKKIDMSLGNVCCMFHTILSVSVHYRVLVRVGTVTRE
jgi:hypothetical protein